MLKEMALMFFHTMPGGRNRFQLSPESEMPP